MKKKVRIYKKPCYKCGGQPHMEKGGAFEPHMMFDPKTGKGYPAEIMEDHLAMKEQGFLHKDEMPKKQFGGKQFGKRLAKELKSDYKPFSSTAPQNQNTDEVVGERKNMFVSQLSNNAFVKMAEEEQQSLQQLHQQMKMGGAPMYDQYGGQYTANEYMSKMYEGGPVPPESMKKLKSEDKNQYFYALLKEAQANNPSVFKYAFYDEDWSNWVEDIYKKYDTDEEKQTKGAKEALLEFYNRGAVQEDAVIDYLEALTYGNPAEQLRAADAIEKYDIDWNLNLGFDTDQNKLSDMSEVIREQARQQLYKNRDEQYKQFQGNYQNYRNLLVKTLDNKIAAESDPENKKEFQIVKDNLREADKIIGDPKSIGVGKDYDKIGIFSDDYTEFSLHEAWNKTFHEAYTDFIKAYDNYVVGADESKKIANVYPGIREGYFYDNPNAATWLSTGYREEADQQLADALYKVAKQEEEGSGQESTEDVGAGAGAADANQTQAATTAAPPVEIKPTPQQVAPKVQKPVKREDPAGYEPASKNVIPRGSKYTKEEQQLIIERAKAAVKKYGGELEKYQTGQEYTDKLGKSYDYDWGIDEEEKSNFFNMFRNPNRDYGYTREDGAQIRMNRRGDEKIDLAGTYANAFRANPWATGIGTASKALGLGLGAKLAINEAREDNKFEDFMQKQTLADNQFMPYSDVMRKGDYTVNQAYSNPMLATMASPYGGDIYQYGGDVYMSDEEIQEFLKAGGQIEYLD
jgi:hypothetical protein